MTAVLGGLAACAATTRQTQSLQGPPPHTIAVLPLEGGNLPPRGRAIVRRLLGSALQFRHYATLDDEFVDQRLALAGYQPWQERWLPADAELSRIGRELGVEAVLVAEGFEDSRFEAGVFYRRGLEGRLRLFEVAAQRTVWSATAGDSGSGGVLTGSGQIVRALADTFEGSDAVFVRHAASISLDLMEALPENPTPPAAAARPQVRSVALGSSRDGGVTLQPNDRVTVEVLGTPGCRASASVGAQLVGYPLVEVTNGCYRGTIRVEPGSGTSNGPVGGGLIDAYGGVGESQHSATSVAFLAPRLAAPADVVAEITDRQRRSVRLHWQPVAEAKEYLVFRATAVGESRTLAPVATTSALDCVPPEAAGVRYFVQARNATGAASSKSVPVAVTFQP